MKEPMFLNETIIMLGDFNDQMRFSDGLVLTATQLKPKECNNLKMDQEYLLWMMRWLCGNPAVESKIDPSSAKFIQVYSVRLDTHFRVHI